ncbi:hypothetical protein YC2023_027679 [Brassica napus]
MGSISDSEEQFTFDPKYSPPNTVDLGTHQVMATLAALEEVDDQFAEGGVSSADRKKQGRKRKLISLTDDTDDSDVEITPPTETTKPRRKTSYGTASRKPMLQSTLDGGIGSSAQACSKKKSVPIKSVIRGGRRKPVPHSQKKRVESRHSQQPAVFTQSQKNKKKIEEIPDFDDELEEDELDETENALEDMENRQRSDVWKDFTVVEKPNGDLKAVCNHCKNEYAWKNKNRAIFDIPWDGPRRPVKVAVRDWAAIFKTASRTGQARRIPPEDEPAAVRDGTGRENPIDIPTV